MPGVWTSGEFCAFLKASFPVADEQIADLFSFEIIVQDLPIFDKLQKFNSTCTVIILNHNFLGVAQHNRHTCFIDTCFVCVI